MKRTPLLFIVVLFVLPITVIPQNFWRHLTDLGNWKVYPIGADNDVVLAERWQVEHLYRNEQPNSYWNIRGPGVTVWDIEFFANDHIILGTDDGAYRSKDAGVSWDQIGLSGIDIYDIYIDNGIAYCACNGYVETFNDALGTWTDLDYNWTDMPNSIIFSGGATYVGSDENTIFTTNAGGWDVVDGVTDYGYASIDKLLEVPGVQYALTSEGLYSSAGGWTTWNPVSDLDHWDNVFDIVRDPANTVYVYNGFKVLKKVAGGAWDEMTSDGLLTTALWGLAYDVKKNELYIAGEGVYKYNKVNDRWDFIGLSPLSCRSSTTSDDNTVYFGTSGAGVLRIKNDTALQKNNGLNFGTISAMAAGPGNVIYAGTELGGLYKSTDQGESWVKTDTVLPGNKVRALVFDASGTLYAGTFGNGVFKSQGSDAGWMQVNNGLSNTFVTSLSYDPATNILFAGTHSNGVFYSPDNGSNWSITGIDNFDVRAVANTGNGNVLVAALNGLYRIPNDGSNWQTTETLITDTSFATVNVNNNGILFAGTELFGAFLSYDGGDSWEMKNSGLEINNLPVRYVTTFTFDQHGYAFAGTVGGGVFKSTDSITGIGENLPAGDQKIELGQNIPNPFDGQTSIEYVLPEMNGAAMPHVTLSVYNAAGILVKTVVDKNQRSGTYRIVFDGSSLPAGIYYYRIKAGSYSVSRKMVKVE